MKRLMIATNLTTATAVRLGLAEAGDGAYPLAEVLPLLAPETRAWVADAITKDEPAKLLTYGHSYGQTVTLDAAPSAESVARGIEALRAKSERGRAEEEADRETRIAAALAAPPEEWMGEAHDSGYWTADGEPFHRRPVVDPQPRGLYLEDAVRHDQRIVAHRARLQAEVLPALVAEWEAKTAAYDREQEAKAAAAAEQEAASEAADNARRAQVAAWAIRHGEKINFPGTILRAAREGRDVYRAVCNEIEDRVFLAVRRLVSDNVDDDAIGLTTYGKASDARVPTERAYAIRDALVAGGESIILAAALPGASVVVGDFERYDVANERKAVWRTGVDVVVTHPWFLDYDFGLRVLTEPLNYSPDADR